MRDDSRTEQATPRRLQEAREKGDVAQSLDLSRTLVLAGALLILFTVGSQTVGHLFRFSQTLWSDGARLSINPDGAVLLLSETIRTFLPLFFWFGITALLISTATAVVSRGWIFLPHRVIPDFGRLRPRGLGETFSVDGLYRFATGLVKIAFCAGILLWFFHHQGDRLIATLRQDPAQLPAVLRETLIPCAIQIILFFLFLGGLDYLYSRWKWNRDLRMTPEEVRREAKEENGSPELKSRRIEMIHEVGRNAVKKRR